MSEILGLAFSAGELDALSRNVGATDKQAKAATRRALSRLRKHAVAVSKRDAAARLGVPQKAIAKRYYADPPDEDGLKIWVGTYRLALSALGTPRQTKAGVRVGRRVSLPGAFIARMPSGHVGVFIRASSRHYDSDLFRRPKSRVRNHGRLPIVAALGVPVADEVEASFLGRRAEFEGFFRRSFEAELNYQINVRR